MSADYRNRPECVRRNMMLAIIDATQKAFPKDKFDTLYVPVDDAERCQIWLDGAEHLVEVCMQTGVCTLKPYDNSIPKVLMEEVARNG